MKQLENLEDKLSSVTDALKQVISGGDTGGGTVSGGTAGAERAKEQRVCKRQCWRSANLRNTVCSSKCR